MGLVGLLGSSNGLGFAAWGFDFANELSTGQQRMLEIIRALVSEPDLILLDEPTSGLNPVFSIRINDIVKLIRDIRSRGTTIFLIEHNMPVVMDIADRIAVLNFAEAPAAGAAGVRSWPKAGPRRSATTRA